MSKYATILSDVESVFATPLWATYGVSAYPSNYMVSSRETEFVKIEVLPLGGDSDYNRSGISGKVIIQIYVAANQGTQRLMLIADSLDNILQNKHLGTGTKTRESSMSVLGSDRDNPELFRGDYSVDFNYFN